MQNNVVVPLQERLKAFADPEALARRRVKYGDDVLTPPNETRSGALHSAQASPNALAMSEKEELRVLLKVRCDKSP